MKEETENRPKGSKLKDGPIICQSEEYLPEENREKKDLTLAELNHIFKMYLRERDSRKKDISIVGQFSVIYDDPKFAQWHTLSKAEQSDSLSKQVIMPQAYDELIASAKAYKPDADIKGVLVEPMAPRGVEMILGVQNDPTFGPMLLLGSGGTLVELVGDSALCLLPAGDEDILDALRSLKAAALMDGYRGGPAGDWDAVLETIKAIIGFAARAPNDLVSLDVNPLIVRPRGTGVVAADALLVAGAQLPPAIASRPGV